MKPSLLIAGLGNPGTQYAGTRHNFGFRAVEALAQAFGGHPWTEKRKFHASICEGTVQNVPVLFVKPLTFMNCSGEALRAIITFYALDPERSLLVLCDDIDLPVGKTRFRPTGGPGTHNGLKSIIDHLGENFARIRIGAGAQQPGEDLAAYVLSKPRPEEREHLAEAFSILPDMLEQWVHKSQSQ